MFKSGTKQNEVTIVYFSSDFKFGCRWFSSSYFVFFLFIFSLFFLCLRKIRIKIITGAQSWNKLWFLYFCSTKKSYKKVVQKNRKYYFDISSYFCWHHACTCSNTPTDHRFLDTPIFHCFTDFIFINTTDLKGGKLIIKSIKSGLQNLLTVNHSLVLSANY